MSEQSEKKITIKILSATPENKLKFYEISLVDTKTRYKEILRDQQDSK